MKSNNIIRVIAIALCMALAMTTVCFAVENKYAANGAGWILDGVKWICVGIGAYKAALALISRNWTAGLGIIGAIAVIWFICDDPTVFSRIGSEIKGFIGL